MKDIRGAKSIWLATATVFAVSGCAGPGRQQSAESAGEANNSGNDLNVFESTFADPDPCANNSRNIGVAVGVGLGAILGAVVANKNKVAGAAIGAAAGGLAGNPPKLRNGDLSARFLRHGFVGFRAGFPLL
jgi:hypothetical protein